MFSFLFFCLSHLSSLRFRFVNREPRKIDNPLLSVFGPNKSSFLCVRARLCAAAGADDFEWIFDGLMRVVCVSIFNESFFFFFFISFDHKCVFGYTANVHNFFSSRGGQFLARNSFCHEKYTLFINEFCVEKNRVVFRTSIKSYLLDFVFALGVCWRGLSITNYY